MLLNKKKERVILVIERRIVVTNKTLPNVLEDISIALGVAISIEQIETILGIIILVIQIVWILWKCGVSIYNKIKEKRYSEIGEDIKQVQDELSNLKDQVTKDK